MPFPSSQVTIWRIRVSLFSVPRSPSWLMTIWFSSGCTCIPHRRIWGQPSTGQRSTLSGLWCSYDAPQNDSEKVSQTMYSIFTAFGLIRTKYYELQWMLITISLLHMPASFLLSSSRSVFLTWESYKCFSTLHLQERAFKQLHNCTLY